MSETNHLAIDIEDWTRADPHGVVRSIAAVRFDPLGGIADRIHLDMRQTADAQIARGRVVEQATVRWWREQRVNPFRESVPVFLLAEALTALTEIAAGVTRVWCRGPDKDFAALLSLFGELPWEYWQQRDARTLDDLVKPVASSTPHCALDDALACAAHVQAWTRRMRAAGLEVAA